jgi:hypothetical protein
MDKPDAAAIFERCLNSAWANFRRMSPRTAENSFDGVYAGAFPHLVLCSAVAKADWLI